MRVCKGVQQITKTTSTTVTIFTTLFFALVAMFRVAAECCSPGCFAPHSVHTTRLRRRRRMRGGGWGLVEEEGMKGDAACVTCLRVTCFRRQAEMERQVGMYAGR